MGAVRVGVFYPIDEGELTVEQRGRKNEPIVGGIPGDVIGFIVVVEDDGDAEVYCAFLLAPGLELSQGF